MINKELQNKIIHLIPSATVKHAIYQQNHQFSDLEFVQLIIEFAPTWNQMMDYLLEMKTYIEDKKIVAYINEHIEVEKKQYEMLVSSDSNYVYEVDMHSGSSGDKYLCPNYESTYITIDSYEKAYKEFIDIRIKTNIFINKCKVAVRSNPDEIDKGDNPVYAILNSNKEIIRIYSDLDSTSLELEMKAIRYPDIFKEGDLVYVDTQLFPQFHLMYGNYYSDCDENKRFGINSFDNIKEFEDEVDVCCFLDLSSEYVEYKKIEKNINGYCDYLMDHIHIDFGYLEKANIEKINPKIKDDYTYAKEVLTKLGYLNQ